MIFRLKILDDINNRYLHYNVLGYNKDSILNFI